ncbi:hypothetical protein [Vitiosangium sp. GDMCC 1.1324]|uniref:hypothetical protein n=1 Tax=Vitiosangium sp. (strain GDMCC 1.1324) TaxID=2138576 RepID=UPI000D346724|nr:hypothetical protein [Vitiosangium sp. GDMCC 1.1324]PTL81394.1 hypothetical protein DAT35_25155 [Vitiosangium sp. GDMCC 1.1324]
MAGRHTIKPTESKFKGGAEQTYVTYDLPQRTRGGKTALYPKVKRVYIAGDIEGWKVGDFEKRSGRKVHGVRIDYAQQRAGYARRSFAARRGSTRYQVSGARVEPGESHFSKVVEVPAKAQNVRFRGTRLPQRYQSALQNVH